MSRAALYTLLSGDSQLASIGLKQTWAYQAVDTPKEDEKPFIVIHWDEASPGPAKGARGGGYVTLWVYDTPADYVRITNMIERCKTILSDITGVTGSDGWVLTRAMYSGESGDLYDDVYGCILRTVTFEVGSRPV